MSIEVRNITKTFGNFVALKDVSFKVETGELVALLGPSGSGKTTLLRIIAGIDVPDEGNSAILIHDEDTSGTSFRERRVGFVFQHYALFRHMTIFENFAFGLRVRPRRLRPPEDVIHQKVSALLKLVQLDWLGDRYPSQLSGGQRQRVALARALAVADRVVLMNQSRIEQIGKPEEVYHHPANAFVYNFLGNVNLFHSRVEEGKVYLG